MFPLEGKPLQAFVGAVGDDDGGRAAGAVVEGDAVREVELARAGAGFAERGEPAGVAVVAVDAVRSVAVGEEEAAVELAEAGMDETGRDE